MKKQNLSKILRNFGVLYYADWMRFYAQRFKNRKINSDFKKQNPEVKLPPDYLIYESFQINYDKYFFDAKDTAKWIMGHCGKYVELKNKRILDWGCGPGRVIRHLPSVVGNNCEYYGTDYNKESIAWCSENLPEINFNLNPLAAELPYADDFVDVIYGISIFTHLSEQMHFDWYKELYRVLRPGGVMFLTTQGDNFKTKMTEDELKEYENDELVVRGNVKEGHRTFSAFHPKGFMKKLFGNAQILEHIERKPESDEWVPQDVWLIRKQ